MGEQAIKKKFIIVLISLFLITCCIPSLGYAVNIHMVKNIDQTTSEIIYCDNDFFPFVIKSSPVDQGVNNIDDSLKPEPKYTPDYFCWMDYSGEDWTTPVKSQGWCGSCWAFAALGVLESVIEIREGCSNLNPDLSEQYVLSYLPKAGSCMGGTCSLALEYIINTSYDGNYHNGVALESFLPYKRNDNILPREKNPDWDNLLVPIENYYKWFSDPDDIEEIKTQIMQSGPVAVAMHMSFQNLLNGL